MPNTVISRQNLQKIAPSVFATQPWDGVSDSYKFVSTIDMIDMLADEGFLPVLAAQSKTRIEGKRDFVKHMVKLRQAADVESTLPEIPELLLRNSHDRGCAVKIQGGIFRTICINGLVVQSEDFGSISIRHMGKHDFHAKLIDATYEVVDQNKLSIAQLNEWKQIPLSRPEQISFATTVAQHVLEKEIEPEVLLRPRRMADTNPDLWSTMNVVQENSMKGKIPTRTGRRTQAVRSVDKDLKVNKAIWALTEAMARLKA